MIEKWIVITPQNIAVGNLDDTDHSVTMQLLIHPDHLHLAPAVGVAIRMTPAEVRETARKLLRTADAAEVGLPRA
jgi:hypothetical protein